MLVLCISFSGTEFSVDCVVNGCMTNDASSRVNYRAPRPPEPTPCVEWACP